MARGWFVVHTLTGQEEKVKGAIEKDMGQDRVKGLIHQVLIPTEKVSEVKRGKKQISERKFFPGYVLVDMEFNDESWAFLKGISGVSGFIGAGNRPIPLADEEIQNILKQAEDKKEKPTPKVIFEKGEGVRVTEGPFVNFNGTVEEVNLNKGKLKVTVSIFGRATPVELEFWQVEKL